MAEIINEIIGKEAFDQIKRMEVGLNGLVETFVKSSNAAKLLETALSGTQGVKATTEQIKQLNAAQSQNEAILKKIAIAESEYGKEVAANAVRLQALNTANKNAAREMNANEGSVNQMSATLIKLRLQYDAMSESLRKSPLGTEIVKRIMATDAALKALDGNTGRFQRNVGDYKNQLFGLTQVFRELPGFTYSAQTGILGLSNNLPILADNFKSVAAATNEVTGKVNGTMGALKIFGASIFSFGNIFAIAIGLFTIFSKEIFAFFQNTQKAIDVTDEFTNSIAKESAKMLVLQNAIEDVNLPMSKRLEAIAQLKKEYPGYFDGLSDEALLAGRVADAYDRVSKSIERKARANVAMKEVEKIVARILQAEKELATALTSVGGVSNAGFPLAPTTPGAISVENQQRQARELKEKELQLLKQELATYIKINVENTESFNTTKKTTDELSKRAKASTTTKEGKTYNMKGYGDVMKALDMFAKEDSQIGAQAELLRQRFQKYIDENPIELKMSWTLGDRLDFEEFVEGFMIATDLLDTASDAKYAKEMEQIDQRNKALQSSYELEKLQINQSADTQEKKAQRLANLEARKEAEQKRIERDRITAARKAAQYERALTIANIITSGALAVIKQEAATPLPAGAVPVGLVIASVAANLARAIATPIPQYAKGTDNHKGGLAIVGEQGTELGILPSGKTFLTPATDTIMDLPAHTKIIPHEKLMQSVYNVAFKKLGNGNKVSTDSMQIALLESFHEMTNEMKGVKKEIRKLKLGVNLNGDMEHFITMKKIIS